MPYDLRRRGNAAAWATSLLTLLGFAAIVVDLGYARSSDAQLDAVAEAAAMAGASYLDGSEESLEIAKQGAIDVAAQNTVNRTPVTLEPTDVELGQWDASTKTFSPTEDVDLVNAVRVFASRSDQPTFFARATFGVSTLGIAGSAVAQRGEYLGAGAVDCFLPIALPDCIFDSDDDTVETMVLRLQPAGTDNVGWARMNGSWSSDYNRDQINDSCASGTAYAGDDVNLANGISATSLFTLDDALEASTTTWDSAMYGDQPDPLGNTTLAAWGHTLEGPIILFEDDSYCSGGGGSWTGNETSTGFAWGVLFDVAATGNSATRNIQLRVDLSNDHHVGTSSGADNHGITFIGPSHGVL